ncbi:PadR family transcriptional regulator [Naasia sp. SYSU D00948]|uniref:PadR family transcriptional regulator n=1 Tax=Naasia sp. SYSU D00948 TaxID=2817379 RepID=UPI001B30D97D|nr:PadR family transcriptional regulator [Naasia sp. SYSU D00948]
MLQRLDVVVLGLLSVRPRTGYDVRKWLDRYGWSLGYTARTSQIYRHLARLVERGWATSSLDPREAGPDAKLYGITEAGRAAFEEWVDSPYEPAERPMDPDFQVRMTFTRHRGPQVLLELVRTELAYRRAQHDRPVVWDGSLLPLDSGPEEREWSDEVSLLLQQRGRLLAGNLITWLESTEARLALLVRNSAPHHTIPSSTQEESR